MSDDTADDPLAEFRAAADRVRTLRSDLADEGLDRAELETVADAYRSVETVLERWEERATDWDDFEGYVKFRDDLADTLDSIPEDVPEQDAFLEADRRVKTDSVSTTLNGSDFDAAREALAPARRYAELRSALESALERRRAARKRLERQRTELTERIEALERLLELGAADLDAPIEQLREPIAEYNDRIEAAFRSARRDATAEELLTFVDTASRTPFVGYDSPPDELLEYVRRADAGAYSIEKLLEYADYSASKLSHYVDDAQQLKRRVATNRTYLERLSADPLALAWPPAPAAELQFRIRELLPLAGRIADEETVALLRRVRELTRDAEYDRIRRAAQADDELTAAERRRLERGEVGADLETARDRLDRIETALEEHAD
jgi:DNA repair exonuclease SbcCD ATPase subunit